jgi:transcriptional regulator with XRE-family HTH domain
MLLSDYLNENELSDAAFARLIGVERQTVGRYQTGDRFPERHILLRIFEVTAGKVTANDFIDFGSKRDSEHAGAA